MRQRANLFVGPIDVHLELPAATEELLPGIRWGRVEAFPTPAYWAYQVMARRAAGRPVRYRLGSTLLEEVAACLLGGHGIPATVGVTAFERLRARGILASGPTEEVLLEQLKDPLLISGRPVRYRFAAQKAKYLAVALRIVRETQPPTASGVELRDWLLGLPGIGYKTASWIARNWLDADDVAILDIHILRAGRLTRFFADDLTVERDYIALESQFLQFSRALGVRPSELDATIWLEMASSGATVHELLRDLSGEKNDEKPRRRSHARRAHIPQRSLID
jgi:N-glycosylase/DNA lyase